jgi:hypothetical protein
MENKTCAGCLLTKGLTDFYLKLGRPSGAFCKECFKAKMHSRRCLMRPELREKQRDYCRRNKEKVLKSHQEWAAKNKERTREYARAYYRLNHEKQRSQKNALIKKQRQDPSKRLRWHLSRRMNLALRDQGEYKRSSLSSYVGCTMPELRVWLEKQFKRGMTWENYGPYWHVDHILPCASFDLADPNQVLQCFHFTNLRPLKAFDNVSKGGKITEPQMALLL